MVHQVCDDGAVTDHLASGPVPRPRHSYLSTDGWVHCDFTGEGDALPCVDDPVRVGSYGD